MTAARDEVTADLLRHPRGWLMVRLQLPLFGLAGFDLYLMINTGRPQSALSLRMHQTLIALGDLVMVGGSHFIIRDARLENAMLPDIPVRPSAGPGLLGLEGMLGLDFLEQFAEVRLDFSAMRLTLVRR